MTEQKPGGGRAASDKGGMTDAEVAAALPQFARTVWTNEQIWLDQNTEHGPLTEDETLDSCSETPDVIHLCRALAEAKVEILDLMKHTTAMKIARAAAWQEADEARREVEELREDLDQQDAQDQAIINDICEPTGEMHCACVSPLKREVERLKGELKRLGCSDAPRCAARIRQGEGEDGD